MPKEYTLIGGNGTRVSPLEVTESGTYEAGDSRAFNPVKVNVPSGSSTLSGLTDVDISNPSNGQTLVYNAETGKWENGAGGGGGGAIIINVTEVTDYNSRPEEDDPYMLGNVSATLNEIQEAFTTNPKPVFMRIPKFQWESDTHFSYADSDGIIMLPVSYGNGSVHYESPNPLDGLKTFDLDRGLGSDVLEFYATFTVIH